MDDSFVNPWKEVILTSGASESAPVGCFIISLSIYYWLFKCGVLHIVCVCVWERERQDHITVESAVLIAACVQIHTSIITESVMWLCSPFGLELMVKLRTLLTLYCLYIYLESWSSRLWKGTLHFRRVLAVFGQSQCTVPVGQSEQTALVGRRNFVENEAFERGGS